MAYDYYQDIDNVEGLSFEQLLVHLNVDQLYDDEHDEFIRRVYLPAAWESCEKFCNRLVFPDEYSMQSYREEEEVAGRTMPTTAMVISRSFKAAVLLTLGHLYRNRESTTAERIVELPLGVHSLLWPFRANLGI